MKKYFKIIAVILLVLVIVFIIYTAVSQDKPEQVENSGSSPHATGKTTSITNGDETAQIRDHLETLLLIGTDTEQFPVYETELDEAFANGIQCDVFILLVIDNEENTVTPIQISRDTMCDIPWLTVTGELGGTFFGQIALAYNSGSGREDSCEITVDTVRQLLFEAPIDHYIAFSMDSIAVLNDLVGGVPVTITEDMTSVDASFIPGETVVLSGDMAEKFVRARKSLENDTNTARMSRQRVYLESFINCARAAYDADSEFMVKALEKVTNYMLTDLTVEKMTDIVDKLDHYSMQDILVPEGELKIGRYYELYLDEGQLWSIVKEAYC